MSKVKYLKDCFVYCRTNIKHKFYVYKFGRKLKLGRLQLIIHDWQKFSPSEFNGYVSTLRVRTTKRNDGSIGYDPNNISDDFSYAWLHHQHHGKHHWQYWVLTLDNGDGVKALEIPDKYILEMIADWMAVSFVMKNKANDYYELNKDKIILHDNTRKKLETYLDELVR